MVHIDLGVKLEGFCSDPTDVVSAPPRRNHRRPPFAVLCRLCTCDRRGRRCPQTSVKGHEVDAAAPIIVAAGWYHDGGRFHAACWPCYGRMPDGIVEAGNIFTLG